MGEILDPGSGSKAHGDVTDRRAKPKNAWRWCPVVDPETNTIHPPEDGPV